MASTFRVVLRDVNRFDAFDAREFHLPLQSTFPIGRASKNTTKTELVPSPHNAFIDSPVISRDHAALSANDSTGSPRVYLTDNGSMHGTLLNGRRLVPNTPEVLSTGDLLQFGIDVNRNEEHFVARKYTFGAHLSQSFPQGFTVPDAESEEEEEEEEEEDDLDVPDDTGSQQNPLMVDDSDVDAEHSDQEEQEVVLIDDYHVHHAEPIPSDEEHPPYQQQFVFEAPISMVQETYSDEEDDGEMEFVVDPGRTLGQIQDENELSPVRLPDGKLSYAHFLESEASSTDSQDSSYDSEQEVSDSEDEELGMSSLESDEAHAAYETQVSAGLTTPSIAQSYNIFHVNGEAVASTQAPGLPPMEMYPQSFEVQPLVENLPSPLPPPRALFEPPSWDLGLHSRFPPQSEEVMSWYGSKDATSSFPIPSLESFEPRHEPNEDPNRASGPSFDAGGYTFPSEHQPHTFPPISDVGVKRASSPRPNRRTRVSIDEILEDQLPLLIPRNDLKRKANVLEDDEHPMIADPPVIPEDSNDVASATVTAEASPLISQRPKKQPRSVMRKALSKATYPLLGAAGAVVSFTLLSTLPDAFFGA